VAAEPVDPVASGGCNGFMLVGGGDVCPPTLPAPMEGWDDVTNNYTIGFTYKDPDFRIVPSKLMPGVVMPRKVRHKAYYTILHYTILYCTILY
jgi:hypothetical protein